MTRLATFVWRSPPPTAIDEVLVLDEDLARLAVRRPRRPTNTVGAYGAIPDDMDRAALLAAGPGPVTFHVHPAETDPGKRALLAVANRVADQCLTGPRATVTFTTSVTDVAADGTLGIALLAVGAGMDPVVFHVDHAASTVHLSGPEGAITWLPMPRPPTGFINAQAVGVGGMGTPARLPPGVPVGATLRVPGAPGATSVAIEVAGWLSETLPDEPRPEPFAVRTPEAPLPG